MLVTYPLMTVVDDSGAIVSGATVAITSVKDKLGADIAAPGATVRQSDANVAVDYDADAKGEAWIVLAVSKVGSTFTGTNAAPAFYLARDSSRLLAGFDSQGRLAATALDSVVVETGINARQSLSLIGSAVAAIVSGLGTGTVTFYAMAPGGASSTARIIATVANDGTGNRLTVQLQPPA